MPFEWVLINTASVVQAFDKAIGHCGLTRWPDMALLCHGLKEKHKQANSSVIIHLWKFMTIQDF